MFKVVTLKSDLLMRISKKTKLPLYVRLVIRRKAGYLNEYQFVLLVGYILRFDGSAAHEFFQVT